MRKTIAALIMIFCVFSIQCFGITIGSAAYNGSFEAGSFANPDYWTTDAWDKRDGAAEFVWDNEVAHSGEKSIRITNNQLNDGRYLQTVAVKPGAYYKISCWIKTKGVGLKEKGGNISVNLLYGTSSDVRGTSDWKQIVVYGIAGRKQKEFPLSLGLGGYSSTNKGTAWFDDLEIYEVDTIPNGATTLHLYNQNTGSGGVVSKSYNSTAVAIAFLVGMGLVFVAIGFVRKQVKIHDEEKELGERKKRRQGIRIAGRLVIDKKDFWVVGVITLIYLCIALYNLGDFKAPVTSWTPQMTGESFVIDTGRQLTLERFSYFKGMGEGKMHLEYESGAGQYLPLETIELKDVFKWRYVKTDIRIRRIRVTIDKPGATLNEFALFEKGSTVPVQNIKLTNVNVFDKEISLKSKLFDEQDIVDYDASYKSGIYFDEIYHVKTAFENITRMEPTETSHPPLGKLFIALGMLIFGVNPFGWRLIGTLFGAAMIPLIYLFAKKIFGNRFYAFSAAFLLMFDFMHFVQTRIATIDSFVTLFIILMYYYMYDYFVNKSYDREFGDAMKPLFLSGLFLGLGAASKWIALYGAAGLAFLFFLAKWQEYKDYKKLRFKRERPDWMEVFYQRGVVLTFLWCMIFFIAIPILVYVASYIPYLMVKGVHHNLADIMNYQSSMFGYHNNLTATHPFQSSWYTWPFDYKPMWFYAGTDLAGGMASSIVTMGNPAVWWVGVVAIPLSGILAYIKKDKKILVVLVAILSQYLPWVMVHRAVFIYHYFSVVPFMVICIVYVAKYAIEELPAVRYGFYCYLVLVMYLFCMFYPVLSGMEVPKTYIDNYLRWFKGNWIF